MRLNCPNCGAQYEVDDAVIPEAGRDVQCSNCGHTWFQQSASRGAASDEEFDMGEDLSPPPPPVSEDPKPKGLDPEVADVLRAEAEREAAQRQSDVEGLETQPDLGLDETDKEAANRTAAARARMARLRGLDDNADEAAAAGLAGARRNRLPEVDEIEMTPPKPGEQIDDIDDGYAEPKKKSRTGRFIFRLILLVVILGIVVYLLAPQIIEWLPQSEPYMISYVDWANQLRAQINQGLDRAITSIKDLIAGFTG